MAHILISLVIVVTMLYGWWLNLSAILEMEQIIWTGKTVVATLGVVVVPLGTFMGYFIW